MLDDYRLYFEAVTQNFLAPGTHEIFALSQNWTGSLLTVGERRKDLEIGTSYIELTTNWLGDTAKWLSRFFPTLRLSGIQ